MVATTVKTHSRTRDLRLDFVRGLALVCVYIDHVPGNLLAAITLRAGAMCDASEVLVMTSGLASALAYGTLFERDYKEGAKRLLLRLRTLYLAQIAIAFSTIAALLLAARFFENAAYYTHSTLKLLPASEFEAIGGILSLALQPGYLHVLPLYFVFLAWMPAALYLSRRHLFLPLVPSFVLWCFALNGANLPAVNEPTGWYFNPLAWQFLFTIGLVLGTAAGQGVSLVKSRWLVAAALLVIGFGLIVAAPWAQVPGLENFRLLEPEWLGLSAKQNLSPLRLANILALAYLAIAFLNRGTLLLNSSFGRFIGLLGRNGLLVFCVATALDEWLLIVRMQGGRGVFYQFSVNVAGVAFLWGLARLSEQWQGRRRTLPSNRRPSPRALLSLLPVQRFDARGT